MTQGKSSADWVGKCRSKGEETSKFFQAQSSHSYAPRKRVAYFWISGDVSFSPNVSPQRSAALAAMAVSAPYMEATGDAPQVCPVEGSLHQSAGQYGIPPEGNVCSQQRRSPQRYRAHAFEPTGPVLRSAFLKRTRNHSKRSRVDDADGEVHKRVNYHNLSGSFRVHTYWGIFVHLKARHSSGPPAGGKKRRRSFSKPSRTPAPGGGVGIGPRWGRIRPIARVAGCRIHCCLLQTARAGWSAPKSHARLPLRSAPVVYV